jgi:asparagine synthase (glutamine-hydrolysing)
MGWAAGADDTGRQGPFQIGQWVCQLDGRIDNRTDLLRQTGCSHDCPNTEMLATLYRQKGVDGLGDVIGDWSVAIWDAGKRQIVLASDYAGIRPLYYHRSAQTLVWSSTLADLVHWTGISELDDRFTVGFLANSAAPAATPYANIFAVPAGHAVLVSEDQILARSFWTFPVDRKTEFRDEREYEERLLELFRQSVQVRLARNSPTCAELSGGLDSSSVVCMANGLRGDAGLITLSYTHPDSVDEKYFREVGRFCQLPGCYLPLDEQDAASEDQVGAIPSWWEPRFRKLSKLMAEAGSSVLLTGQLGDFAMGNNYDGTGQVAEWLSKRRFSKALRTAYAWGRAAQAPLYPILWRGIRQAYSSWSPSLDPQDAVGAMPASTEDSLVSKVRTRLQSYLRERMASEVPRPTPPARRQLFQAAAEVCRSRRLQTPEALRHISYSHPYSHRPLLEFMLTIPSHVVFGPGQPRRLMRRAFDGLLPPMIVTRKSKASYATSFRAPLMPLAKQLLRQPTAIELVKRGYLDVQSLVNRLEKFTQGIDCHETQLRQIILLEFWLRNRMPAS